MIYKSYYSIWWLFYKLIEHIVKSSRRERVGCFMLLEILWFRIGIFEYRRCCCLYIYLADGPLVRYVELRVAHAPEMPGTFSPPPISKETASPGMHHDTGVTHVLWCMSGSLASVGGENVPGIPGACATRNFAYLARGPLNAGVNTFGNLSSSIRYHGVFDMWVVMNNHNFNDWNGMIYHNCADTHCNVGCHSPFWNWIRFNH